MEQSELWNEFYRTQARAWRGITDLGDLPFGKGSRVLEIGCGNGKTLAALIDRGCDAVGIDFSETAVESCRKLLGEDADVRYASVLALPFEAASFDGAVMFHVLENLTPEDCARASSEIGRVLKDGGALAVRSFAVGDLRSEKGERISEDTVVRGNGIRYRYFTEESLKASFPDAECIAMTTVTETTRFGAARHRIEAMFRF